MLSLGVRDGFKLELFLAKRKTRLSRVRIKVRVMS